MIDSLTPFFHRLWRTRSDSSEKRPFKIRRPPRRRYGSRVVCGARIFRIDTVAPEAYLIKATSRSITAQVKQEGIFLNVGEPETAMLYEIKEVNGKFKLFFNKKTGLKFKKAFRFWHYLQGEWVERRAQELEQVEQFVERYLRQCCIPCKERGWVYKTRHSGGIHGGGASHGKGNRASPHWGNPPAGTIVFCPECRAKHEIGYENRMVLGLRL